MILEATVDREIIFLICLANLKFVLQTNRTHTDMHTRTNVKNCPNGCEKVFIRNQNAHNLLKS